ncbi:T9SS type A sorting domain-containing protein [Maribacter aquivivus]|uniref:T9SS type A sorting domain-containing protein n=1 Tax=Maribacter aquivivus TaxID=228958 RepID=UPI00248F6539|nr:T9SS type A sorting domain-containing protein [Maribacter aquivivus]
MKFLFAAILMILFCPLFGQTNSDVDNTTIDHQTNYSINSGGGEALSQQGNYSYSIGQIFSTQVFKQEGQIDSGVQQGFDEQMPESNIQVIDSIGVDFVLIPNPVIDSVALDIIAYPNPVVDILYVNKGNQDFENLTFQVFDFGGKLIKNGILENSISEIRLDYIRSGIYLLIVVSNDETLYSLKLIKK